MENESADKKAGYWAEEEPKQEPTPQEPVQELVQEPVQKAKKKAKRKAGKKADPTLAALAELSGKMDKIVAMVKETSQRVDLLESRAEVLQGMMREEAPKIEEFKPLKRKEYPDAVLLAIAKGKMKWHTVVPLRDVPDGITINQFTVPFRRGVKMDIPTSWRDDAARRGDAQENPIL